MNQGARNKQTAKGNKLAQTSGSGDATVNANTTHVWNQATTLEIDPDDLARAEEKQATLNPDIVPDPGNLSPGSHLPWPSHHDFVGRQDDLKQLATLLKANTAAAISQIAAATGMGGIGKTQLASAFAHRYGQYFMGGVQWISLADPEAVSAEIVKAGSKMFPNGGFTQKPLEEQIALVLGAWQSPMPRLLVFDNCEDEELLQAWRPPIGGARILVTSRRQQWSRRFGIKLHALGVFSRDESLELLLKHRPDLALDDSDLDQIADRLGDLPLALHLAGSYLERYRFDAFGAPGAYLEELQKPYFLEHHSLIEGDVSPTDHEQHVGRTFALSYERLDPGDEADGLAVDLPARASCFAPGQPIPRALLLASLGEGEGGDGKACADALARLLSLGLLQQEDDGALVLHRLLVLFVQHRIEDLSVSRAAVEEVIQTEAGEINQSGLPASLLAWQGHLRHVAEIAAERQSEAAGGLFNELGTHLWGIAT